MGTWDDKPSPAQAKVDWHRDAVGRDEAQLAQGPDDDRESGDGPWVGATVRTWDEMSDSERALGDWKAGTDRTPALAGLLSLTFTEVAAANLARAKRWHPDFPNDGWTGSDWSNAMAGEAGETCNVVKKLRRAETGVKQAAADTRAELLAKLANEIGDTFLYLDLLAQFYGLDLSECVAGTFNRVSEREGFPDRIDTQP